MLKRDDGTWSRTQRLALLEIAVGNLIILIPELREAATSVPAWSWAIALTVLKTVHMYLRATTKRPIAQLKKAA